MTQKRKLLTLLLLSSLVVNQHLPLTVVAADSLKETDTLSLQPAQADPDKQVAVTPHQADEYFSSEENKQDVFAPIVTEGKTSEEGQGKVPNVEDEVPKAEEDSQEEVEEELGQPEVLEPSPETDKSDQDNASDKPTEVPNQPNVKPSLPQAPVVTPDVSDKLCEEDKQTSNNPNTESSALSYLTPFVDDVDMSPLPPATYVKDWSGEDAYSHNLLSQRYGISAEQLDGFLRTTGIAYDSERINGKLLLEWQEASGLDVRAIVAIAMAESSLGTQGVARLAGANMFGYGAFDHAPYLAQYYDDSSAIRHLTRVTIIGQQNQSFKIQDKKAEKWARGQLDVAREGGVYFTDTSGTGKRRAAIMEDLNKWIDEHGGTPEPPKDVPLTKSSVQAALPTGYQLTKPIKTSGYSALTYPWGQCTWFAFNRARELGYQFDWYMGNGGDWQHKVGYQHLAKPQVGAVASFKPGQGGSSPIYGHVAIVEAVNPDGSILVSESNVLGLGTISYRIFSSQEARQFAYILGKAL